MKTAQEILKDFPPTLTFYTLADGTMLRALAARILGLADDLDESPVTRADVVSATEAPAPTTAAAPPPPEARLASSGTPPAAEQLATPADGPHAGLDADGLPWDARVHSSAVEPKTKDGKWKRKRGVPDDLVRAVEAELRGAAVTADSGGADPAAAFAAPPPPSAAAAAPPAPATGDVPDYKATVSRVVELTGAGKVGHAQVLDILAELKLASLPELDKQPILLATFNQRLDALCQPTQS